MKHSAATLYQKEGTKKVLASLISILVGLLVGGIAVILVGCFNEKISSPAHGTASASSSPASSAPAAMPPVS